MLSFKLVASHFAVALASMLLILWLVLDRQPETMDSATPAPELAPSTTSDSGFGADWFSLPKSAAPAPGIDPQTSLFQQQLVAHQQADRSTPQALKSRIIEYSRTDDPFKHSVLAFIFLEKLIALNPAEAANWVQEKAVKINRQRREGLLHSVMTSWVRYDVDAAVNFLGDIDNLQSRQRIASYFLQDATIRASVDVAALADALGPNGRHLVDAFTAQQVEPEIAFNATLLEQEQQPGQQGINQLMGAFARWYQQDPDAALRRLELMPDDASRAALVQIMINVESAQDPMRALELVQTLAPGDPSLEGGILTTLMTQDPARGLPLLEAYYDRTGNHQLFASAIANWGYNDVEAAINYTRGLSIDRQREVMKMMGHQILQYDPQLAMQMVDEAGDAQIRMQLLSRLPALDLAMAERRLQSNRDPQDAYILMQGIARERANTSVASAIEWLQAYAGEPGYAQAVNSAIVQGTRRDVVDAAQQLRAFSNVGGMAPAFSAVAMQYAHQDADAAESWLATLPQGDNRNRAAGSLAVGMIAIDQQRAMTLANTVTGNVGDQTRMQIAGYLVSQQPDSLDEITNLLSLSPEQNRALSAARLNGFNSFIGSPQMMMQGMYPGVSSGMVHSIDGATLTNSQ